MDTSGAAEEESCGEESEILLWPMHCVENTWGSDLSPQLHMAEKTLRVRIDKKAPPSIPSIPAI